MDEQAFAVGIVGGCILLACQIEVQLLDSFAFVLPGREAVEAVEILHADRVAVGQAGIFRSKDALQHGDIAQSGILLFWQIVETQGKAVRVGKDGPYHLVLPHVTLCAVLC